MSIKFNGLAGYFTNAAVGVRTFPNTDWTFSTIQIFDGLFTGNPQYLCSTGAFQAAGSFHLVYEPAGQANAPGRVHLFLDTSAAPVAISGGTIVAGAAYCFVFQRLNGVVSVRHCPVLASAPTDGSAVIAGTAPVALNSALVGPANFIMGDRGDLSDSRGFFNSAARIFRLDGVTLTDFEVAKLAYGMEITDLGKTPATYFRANTITDITDRGTLASSYAAGAAATQTATTGTAPSFGYVAGGGTGGGTTPATPAVDAVEQLAERVYQRINDVMVVGSSGSWTGPTQPASIEYQFIAASDGTTVIKDWAALNATIAAGNSWTASTLMPKSPNGKKHFIKYRSKDSSGNVLATSAVKTNRFAVGDIHAFFGSSSAEKSFYADSGTGFTPDYDTTSRYDGNWYTITNGCAMQMASSLAAQAGVPVAFLDYGIGGSSLVNWIDPSYSQWADLVNGINAVGGKLAGCIITVGSNDAAYGAVTSRASHLANWRTLIGRVRALTSQPALPICAIGYNRRTDTTVSAAQFAAGSDWVRMAENDIGDDAGVCAVQTMDLLLSSDGIHLASVDAGFPAWGRRAVYQFGLFLKGTYLRGMKQTQVTASGVTTVHTLQHRGSTDFTPTASITGFTAVDGNGAAIALVSSVRTNATTITNTWASAPAKVQFLAGNAPAVGTPPFSNGANPLPMTVETDMLIAATLATKAVFSIVKDLNGTPADDANGLDYAFYDQPRISAGQAPVKFGTTFAISGGTATVDITGVTSLAPGGMGRIEYGKADGTTLGGGQVVVQ